MNQEERIRNLTASLKNLTLGQLNWIEKIIEQFNEWKNFTRLESSDLIDSCTIEDFGDTLRIHHCFSKEPLTKDKFEYALERVFKLCGIDAKLAPRGNPGYDITIENVKYSLKTQADQAIKEEHLHISKFMELGKGEWGEDKKDLIGLRDQFFEHLESYDRILSLRCLPRENPKWFYELVEIPKVLLLEAKNGELKMMYESTQSPKPGYCHIKEDSDEIKYQLYFDGGGERKLQIKNLKKKHCIVHATWEFISRMEDEVEPH